MPMMPFIGDLVAHVGEELALGLARIQRLIAGHDEILIDVLDLFEHAVEAVAQGAEFVVTYLDDATTAASASPVIITIGIVVKASI